MALEHRTGGAQILLSVGTGCGDGREPFIEDGEDAYLFVQRSAGDRNSAKIRLVQLRHGQARHVRQEVGEVEVVDDPSVQDPVSQRPNHVGMIVDPEAATGQESDRRRSGPEVLAVFGDQ